ncbi:hypothetical protein EYF80_024862 [Liparis tanakae]|uniref:Uncharacterized protein n=1 Tax=Liparis tanakae TaxID=230148 RepID=A0A4Z2HGH0_9TELE|nr:hypothetical protein EYF80_024862 [Liparis tanakae]
MTHARSSESVSIRAATGCRILSDSLFSMFFFCCSNSFKASGDAALAVSSFPKSLSGARRSRSSASESRSLSACRSPMTLLSSRSSSWELAARSSLSPLSAAARCSNARSSACSRSPWLLSASWSCRCRARSSPRSRPASSWCASASSETRRSSSSLAALLSSARSASYSSFLTPSCRLTSASSPLRTQLAASAASACCAFASSNASLSSSASDSLKANSTSTLQRSSASSATRASKSFVLFSFSRSAAAWRSAVSLDLALFSAASCSRAARLASASVSSFAACSRFIFSSVSLKCDRSASSSSWRICSRPRSISTWRFSSRPPLQLQHGVLDISDDALVLSVLLRQRRDLRLQRSPQREQFTLMLLFDFPFLGLADAVHDVAHLGGQISQNKAKVVSSFTLRKLACDSSAADRYLSITCLSAAILEFSLSRIVVSCMRLLSMALMTDEYSDSAIISGLTGSLMAFGEVKFSSITNSLTADMKSDSGLSARESRSREPCCRTGSMFGWPMVSKSNVCASMLSGERSSSGAGAGTSSGWQLVPCRLREHGVLEDLGVVDPGPLPDCGVIMLDL